MDGTLSWSAAVTVAALAVTVLIFRFLLLATNQPTSLTATNTLINAATTSELSKRRISRQLSLWQTDHSPDLVDDGPALWSFKSKPIPSSVRPCLKQRQITPASGVELTPHSPPGSGSVTPSTAGASSFAGSASTSVRRRQVRVVEPDKAGLEELRAFWKSVGGSGYRPTALFAKAKSGGAGPAAAVAPKVVVRVGVPLTPGESDKEDSEGDEDESSDDSRLPTAKDTPTPIGRPSLPRLAVPIPTRKASLSPTRASRIRAGSPAGSPTGGGRSSSPAFVASRPGAKRRNHSSSPAPAPAPAPKKEQGKVQFADSDSSSSEFEDMTSTDVSRQNSPERERPKVTVTAPAPATTTPPTSSSKVGRSATPAPPTMVNGPNKVSSSSPTAPPRTSSMHMPEGRQTRMMGGRQPSLNETQPHALLA